MIDREKLMAGLEHCGTRCGCNEKCPYFETDCKTEMAGDVRTALREDADEIEHLRDQVYNLTLYLSELLVDTDVYDRLEQQHPGLPGYVEDENGETV